MMLQWLILLTLFVHNSLAFGLYDDTDDYDLWRRELGGPGVQPTSETKNDCRKDILVVLDSSQSVGALYFRSIRKFLITLVEKLNVRKDGTQIGFITFSNSTRTKKLLDVGEKTDATELIDWLKKLSYEGELMGDYTRTGLAFQIANNMFSLKSPSNARNTVEDVILLFTDGEPHSPHGNDGERKIVETETNKLKEKDVTIVAVAVGTPAQIKTFKKYIKTWVTDSSEVAETSWDTLEKDVDELVNMLFNPLCKPEAGECSCKGDSAATVTAYMKKGEITTQVEWVDAMACTGSASYTVNPPDAKSGDRFGLGEHVITYSSSYTNNAGKNVDLKCPVQVTVVTCECPSIQTVQAHHLPGVDKTSYASWTEPAPNCPAQPNPSRAHSGWFYAGETTVTHKYRVANKFDLECPVKIVVPGEFCGNTAYDPATQVCCCGKVSSKKNDGHSHRCCGQNYINPGKKMCCQGNKPVRLPGSCGP